MDWVNVPVQPTAEMLERAIYAQQPNQPLGGSGNANRLRRRAARIWAAMLEGAEHERRTQQEREDCAAEGAAGKGGAQPRGAEAAAAGGAQGRP